MRGREPPQFARAVARDRDQIAGLRRRAEPAGPVDAVGVHHAMADRGVCKQAAERAARLDLKLMDRLAGLRVEHVIEAALLTRADHGAAIRKLIDLRRIAEVVIRMGWRRWKADCPSVVGIALI